MVSSMTKGMMGEIDKNLEEKKKRVSKKYGKVGKFLKFLLGVYIVLVLVDFTLFLVWIFKFFVKSLF